MSTIGLPQYSPVDYHQFWLTMIVHFRSNNTTTSWVQLPTAPLITYNTSSSSSWLTGAQKIIINPRIYISLTPMGYIYFFFGTKGGKIFFDFLEKFMQSRSPLKPLKPSLPIQLGFLISWKIYGVIHPSDFFFSPVSCKLHSVRRWPVKHFHFSPSLR